MLLDKTNTHVHTCKYITTSANQNGLKRRFFGICHP